MSDEQENSPEANGPKPIRIGKRSLFTPSEAVAVEQHSVTPHVSRTRYGTARIEGRLSSPNARVPAVISQHCGGITVKGHTLKSFAYTTDAAIIRNTKDRIMVIQGAAGSGKTSATPMPTPFSPYIRSPANQSSPRPYSPRPRPRCSSAWAVAPPQVHVWPNWPWWPKCKARQALSSMRPLLRKPSKPPC